MRIAADGTWLLCGSPIDRVAKSVNRAPHGPNRDSQPAFDAIAKTLPLGSVGYENAVNEKCERLIWLDPGVVDRLRSLRGPGESYSDVILRLAAGDAR
jgi:hypothetical protein